MNKVSDHQQSGTVTLTPVDNQRLAILCGQFDEHLRQIETYLGVEIHTRGNVLHIIGTNSAIKNAEEVINKLYEETDNKKFIDANKVYSVLKSAPLSNGDVKLNYAERSIQTPHLLLRPRSPNQYYYLDNILRNDINFGIGPAGTGKTFLAVACAVSALEREKIRRIILVRPAVEAGERLGFLPGDLAQKIDPYLRPLYDALYEMLGIDQVNKLIERNIIEVAPLAYMRGRTLDDAFIILDESQNTTKEQMQMFLTRMGFSSKAVITGDITQIDLPKNVPSGLIHAMNILKGIEGISFTHFEGSDVVRHPLVQQIVQAYEKAESK